MYSIYFFVSCITNQEFFTAVTVVVRGRMASCQRQTQTTPPVKSLSSCCRIQNTSSLALYLRPVSTRMHSPSTVRTNQISSKLFRTRLRSICWRKYEGAWYGTAEWANQRVALWSHYRVMLLCHDVISVVSHMESDVYKMQGQVLHSSPSLVWVFSDHLIKLSSNYYTTII